MSTGTGVASSKADARYGVMPAGTPWFRRITCPRPVALLFASDFSPASRPALAKAMELTRALKAELIIVHTRSPRSVPAEALYEPIADWDALAKSYPALDTGGAGSPRDPRRRRGLRVQTVIAHGYAAEEILRIARARKVYAIVMGTHGRTGISRLLVGSVATRVMMSATCPVVTVRRK
jgi:nucleotide-binding universal stress UspA family protein